MLNNTIDNSGAIVRSKTLGNEHIYMTSYSETKDDGYSTEEIIIDVLGILADRCSLTTFSFVSKYEYWPRNKSFLSARAIKALEMSKMSLTEVSGVSVENAEWVRVFR